MLWFSRLKKKTSILNLDNSNIRGEISKSRVSYSSYVSVQARPCAMSRLQRLFPREIISLVTARHTSKSEELRMYCSWGPVQNYNDRTPSLLIAPTALQPESTSPLGSLRPLLHFGTNRDDIPSPLLRHLSIARYFASPLTHLTSMDTRQISRDTSVKYCSYPSPA